MKIAALSLLTLIVALQTACPAPELKRSCQFKVGGFVHSILDGSKGQIVNGPYMNCAYYVRFTADRDSVLMRDFELKR